jgi:hypothetical protein
MTQLLNWAKSLFTNANLSDLEKYISRQHPTSVADVEFYTREYQKRTGRTL